MMTTFVWKDEYSTGIKDIDEQHKKLSDFVNQLRELANQDKIDSRKAKRKAILLGAYTKAHFAYLEEWLFNNGYSLVKQDNSIDREFLKFYDDSKNQITKEITKEFLERLCETTETWLGNHINIISKAIAEEPTSYTSDFHDLPLSAQIQSNLLGNQQKAMRVFA